MLTLEARIEPQTSDDALPVDNHRVAIVELRSHLNVAVVDDAVGSSTHEQLLPVQWLVLALDPQGDATDSAVQLKQLNPANVDAKRLDALDAAPGVAAEQTFGRHMERAGALRQAGRGGLGVHAAGEYASDMVARDAACV